MWAKAGGTGLADDWMAFKYLQNMGVAMIRKLKADHYLKYTSHHLKKKSIQIWASCEGFGVQKRYTASQTIVVRHTDCN
jgi:hypothetical protein